MDTENNTFNEKEFHQDVKQVYFGDLHPWVINKKHDKMAKVIYNPIHSNPEYMDARHGQGKTVSTWIFTEDEGLAEHISDTKFNLLIDFTVEPNASVGLHRHNDKEEIYYIIEGEIEMTTVHPDGREHTELLRTGDAHFVKLGQAHYGTAGPNGARILTVCINR